MARRMGPLNPATGSGFPRRTHHRPRRPRAGTRPRVWRPRRRPCGATEKSPKSTQNAVRVFVEVRRRAAAASAASAMGLTVPVRVTRASAAPVNPGAVTVSAQLPLVARSPVWELMEESAKMGRPRSSEAKPTMEPAGYSPPLFASKVEMTAYRPRSTRVRHSSAKESFAADARCARSARSRDPRHPAHRRVRLDLVRAGPRGRGGETRVDETARARSAGRRIERKRARRRTSCAASPQARDGVPPPLPRDVSSRQLRVSSSRDIVSSRAIGRSLEIRNLNALRAAPRT